MADRFEGFTPAARQVVALAETEAARSHHDYLGSVHLLLGLAQGPGTAAAVLSGANFGPEVLRTRAESHVRRGVSTGRTPLRVAAEVHRVVEHAKEEAAELDRPLVDTEHLLLGLLSEPNCVAARMLHGLGADRADLRARVVAAVAPEPSGDRYTEPVSPLVTIGRDAQIDTVARALSRRVPLNVAIHGPAGVGKSSVVRGLAHRITSGDVPRALLNRPLRRVLGDLPAGELPALADCILWCAADSPVLTSAITRGIRVLVTAETPMPAPFHPVELRPLSIPTTVEVLTAVRPSIQAHYGLTITTAALTAAAESAVGPLPGAAIDLLDEACARATNSTVTEADIRPHPRPAFDTDMWTLG
ncbi:Clp protease N-terminal domain-containing protein [Actinokineospora globicatena]|uniref:Clp protease N-terminal domain-containing protein n=1 Tax=Actinokineospora globicatena TaxID=103729 RepID=UPI0020A43667|nr:Clp protease N-terminal domain-containing protein [Actinokineospora globicatena]MCP2305021.1 AAA ATPase domain-containing protein [Actinokineospora globicatena]GLW80483.1 hypothetical protein Aglo01_49640 [Actinokineospora globicatena]GLW87311.1 hypothetical protein Aglo02_49500 [Actinokineospora globicatena]